MQPMFTIHAGEYLVGSYIEERFKKCNVWVPSKDTGIDLLVTNSKNSKAVSIQAKFSKDYTVTHMAAVFQGQIKAWGWWTLTGDKIRRSPADLWVFVMQSFKQKSLEFIAIPPKVLLQRLGKIHGRKGLYQTYLWVTESKKCWETRGLRKQDLALIANGCYSNRDRDFSTYLNKWTILKKKLT
ncbi:MAG: hypothetical protein AMJ75_01340 [Phycisphaerae bacterium SM1_79]|nr:MAG: hypothetical protein AMJ75_01340 [Phycisphaerae bacterium SM1_79]